MIAVLVALAAQIAAPSTGWVGGRAPAAKVAWPTRQAKMHVTTLGSPHRDAAGQIDNAVMVLHGTGGSGSQFLQPQFAEELYAPGQPLDIRRYFIILPDDLGHGSSSKPSDGLRMHFRNMTMTTWSRRSGGWWSKARAWLTSG